MTRLEHLLTIAAEECAEIAQRLSKAQRFGLGEIQPGQELSNAARIQVEVNDLFAVLQMIEQDAELPAGALQSITNPFIAAKVRKVEQFLRLSEQQGTLQ